MDAVARPLCPCCGQPLVDDLPVKALAFLPQPYKSRVSSQILALLIGAWPRSLSTDVIIEHVYASRPSGEPDYAARSINVLVMRLRRRLMPHGWTITDARGSGYRLERVG